jgi:hypothetical protein
MINSGASVSCEDQFEIPEIANSKAQNWELRFNCVPHCDFISGNASKNLKTDEIPKRRGQSFGKELTIGIATGSIGVANFNERKREHDLSLGQMQKYCVTLPNKTSTAF